jgi:hypothetical protein
MSDLVHQEEYINQEEDFQGNSTDVYYIINKATGRAQGKIELHQVENLASFKRESRNRITLLRNKSMH